MGPAGRLATPLCLSLSFHLGGRSKLPLEDRGREQAMVSGSRGWDGRTAAAWVWVLAQPPAGGSDLECDSSPLHASVSSLVTWAGNQASLSGGWGHFKAQAPNKF